MRVGDSDLTIDDLGQIVASDFDLVHRRRGVDHAQVEAAATALLSQIAHVRIGYTAFDGDHFQLCSHMRRYAMQQGCVPANPESILGYKETVTKRVAKRGVLIDDLAVLRGCDELWIFSDLPPKPESLPDLAEGVVVELLYHLRRRQGATVKFISAAGILVGPPPTGVPYTATYEESKTHLHPDQREGVLDLANSGLAVDKELPDLVYHIYDPLDFKYAHWLRPHAYGDARVPLVPGLAVELRDGGDGLAGLGQVLCAWTKLIALASKAWVLPAMDSNRGPSTVACILEHVWTTLHGAQSLSRKRWQEYSIPKARAGNRWPLTRKESGVKW